MQNYFYGWYLKCQSEEQTLALIPSIHQNGEKRSCLIQIITEELVTEAVFPPYAFRQSGTFGNILKPAYGQTMVIGENLFCEKGMRLSIRKPECEINGSVSFEGIKPLKYDIMGPFAFVPYMECRHMVYSMQHSVNGKIVLNGRDYVFHAAYRFQKGKEVCLSFKSDRAAFEYEYRC